MAAVGEKPMAVDTNVWTREQGLALAGTRAAGQPWTIFAERSWFWGSKVSERSSLSI